MPRINRPFVSIVLLAVAFFLLPGLTADAATRDEVRAQLDQSKAKWAEAKETCDGNYEYAIRFSSWIGAGHETTIIVRDNKVVERRYRSWRVLNPGEPGRPDEDEAWTEKGDDLGSHKKGAPLKTLDELYVDAAKALEADNDPRSARYYFKANEAGVMLHCFWVDTRIADDAPLNGVNLKSLKLETPE